MRMQKFQAVQFLRIQLVAMLVVFVGVAHAKSGETHQVWSKIKQLEYPSLPEDVGTNAEELSRGLRPDSAMGRHWPLNNIGFFEAFTPLVQPTISRVKSCSKDIVVAVVDTGIDYTHPELKQNIWVNKGEVGAWTPKDLKSTACRDKRCNGIDDDHNGFVDDATGWDFVHNVPLPFDTHGHGTHIAGIIASAAANGAGVSGVCPNVSIMALKYYDNSVLGYNNLQNTVKAIEYAIRNGAQIINYSGGGSDPAPIEAMAVKKAGEKGILFVAASGNDGRNNDWMPYYPASYELDNIISVASLDQANKLLSSSNYGKKTVDMAAPGLGILSTLPSSRFGTMSGTSQATAFVTGAAALLASQQPSRFDYAKVRSWLLRSSGDINGGRTKKFMTAGTLQVGEALRLQMKEMYGISAPAVAKIQKK
ncbi:MAG: S8 family serine peptidase [Bdellovibrionales bacterium]|nr:S8 family serine peptidase [Bdellovibrionales bacterium]